MFKNIKKQIGSAGSELLGAVFVLALAIVAIYGYIENILKLCRLEHFEGHVGEVIIRGVGIVTGVVGVVAGYF